MDAFGGELVISGKDFDESRVKAAQIEHDRGYHFIPSFHSKLDLGVATYAMSCSPVMVISMLSTYR